MRPWARQQALLLFRVWHILAFASQFLKPGADCCKIIGSARPGHISPIGFLLFAGRETDWLS
jgi:hypothetical protein